MAFQLKNRVSLLILALIISSATSARILDEEEVTAPVGPVVVPGAAAAATTTTAPGGTTTTAPGGAKGAASVAGPDDHSLTFFMHDIMGDSRPSATAVTGLVANPVTREQVPFAKPNGAVLPLNSDVPTNNANGGIVNNNNIPFLTGLSGFTYNFQNNNNNGGNNNFIGGGPGFPILNSAQFPSGTTLQKLMFTPLLSHGVPTNNANGGIVNNNIPFLTGLSGFTSNFQNNNNNGGNNFIGGGPGFPILNSAQFPSGTTLQKLMFGTMTVFDDEVTEGHELGSGLMGKAQGFYIASSEDGTNQTMSFTVMFKEGSYVDSLRFFGVHRTAMAESYLAIMGGTGKYVNSKGFAVVKTFPGNQHETNGVETLLEISVYLIYSLRPNSLFILS
ncbi:hypothetical protein ACS0TY_014747 [Phlomoides rotata]